MSLRRFIFAVLIGIILTVVLGFIGAIMTGGGHYLIPMIVLFPYYMYLIYGMQIEKTPAFVGIFLLCIQFTVYSILLANARDRRQAFYISAALVTVHIIAVIFSYSAYRKSETVGQLKTVRFLASTYK